MLLALGTATWIGRRDHRATLCTARRRSHPRALTDLFGDPRQRLHDTTV
jgi:hypothetical protein